MNTFSSQNSKNLQILRASKAMGQQEAGSCHSMYHKTRQAMKLLR
jgi:hypothetical protein